MKEKIVIVVLILIMFILGYKGCQVYREKQNLLNQVSSYQDGEKAFKVKQLADSSTIAEQKQTILTQNEAIKLGLLKLEGDIKKVQSQVSQSQNINISDISFPFVPDNFADTSGLYARIAANIDCKRVVDTILSKTVFVPKDFNLKDKWYSVDGVINKSGITFDSIKLNNESSVTVGWKKTGFLNLRKEAVVEVRNTNPYLQVTKMDNVVIRPKKGIFDSKLFWGGLGILGGLLLSK